MIILLIRSQADANVEILHCQQEIIIHYTDDGADLSWLNSGKGGGNGTKYYIHSDPGNPRLPCKEVDVVLPPECDLSTLKGYIRSFALKPLSGEYVVPPSPPYTPLLSDATDGVCWGRGKVIDETGRNVLLYQSNTLYPAQPVRILCCGAMGPFKIVRLCVFPFLFKPVSGEILRVKETEFVLRFNPETRKKINVSEKYITSMHRVLASRVANPEMLNRYQKYFSFTPEQETYDFVIITTSSLATSSTALDDFIALKETQGYRVKLVTDAEFGSTTGQEPNGTEEKVRAWLQDNYLSMGIRYVLLLSDPRPASNQIPMKLCWARYGASEYPTIDRCYTDYYYADLSGNWDVDGDQRFGEYNDDRGAGGVDFFPEVFVSRIPYYGKVQDTDAILQKLIAYEVDNGFPHWRRRFLLPTAIAFYENQVEMGSPGLDGATFSRRLCNDIIVPRGFIPFRLFEKSGIAPSPYSCEAPLNTANVIAEWQKGYGFSCLFGHGSILSIYRTIWSYDNGNNIPEPSELSASPFFTDSDVGSLDDSHPAITFLVACNNGNPDFETQLGYALLRQGAVAVVAATAPVFEELGDWQPHTNIADAMSIAYFYFMRIIERGNKLGEAFYLGKSFLGTENQQDDWHNLMAINMLGDPSLFSGFVPEYTSVSGLWTLLY
ncbi:hypothetical protein J7M23_11300 [Candidatus Sumerlaeota bacterium]|nr:hypothetical protein [Candidatus Sumerlaeota bacterium]